jgi:hypothetical protein
VIANKLFTFDVLVGGLEQRHIQILFLFGIYIITLTRDEALFSFVFVT